MVVFPKMFNIVDPCKGGNAIGINDVNGESFNLNGHE